MLAEGSPPLEALSAANIPAVVLEPVLVDGIKSSAWKRVQEEGLLSDEAKESIKADIDFNGEVNEGAIWVWRTFHCAFAMFADIRVNPAGFTKAIEDKLVNTNVGGSMAGGAMKAINLAVVQLLTGGEDLGVRQDPKKED